MNKIKQIGDNVWVLNSNNKIKVGEIIEIDYTIRIKDMYDFDSIRYGSAEVFDSKEELIESLSK